MALNIPINLMSVAAPPAQHTTPQSDPAMGTNTSGALQPAASGADTRGASADGGNGYGQGPTGQQAMAAKNRQQMQAAPDRAEPKSVVTAQLENASGPALEVPRKDAQAVQVTAKHTPLPVADVPAVTNRRQSELDRFAPPDPLPTAPILMAADSYKYASKAA